MIFVFILLLWIQLASCQDGLVASYSLLTLDALLFPPAAYVQGRHQEYKPARYMLEQVIRQHTVAVPFGWSVCYR